MLVATIALILAFAPPAMGPASTPSEAAQGPSDGAGVDPGSGSEDEGEGEGEGEPGLEPEPLAQIQLAPTQTGHYQLFDARGEPVLDPVELGEGSTVSLELPAGLYHIQGPDGVETLILGTERGLTWDGERVLPTQEWEAASRAEQGPAEPEAPEAVGPGEATGASEASEATHPVALAPARRPHNWRAWGSPLGSALLPGLGQFFNGEGGKATGLLFGSLGSIAVASALYTLPNNGSRSAGAEYTRLVSYGLFSTAAPLLWIYGIADAYRVAAGKEVEPHVDHHLRLSVTRMMTVGFRADISRPGFYDDWNVSMMGQATKRLSVGVSDLSVKTNGRSGPQVWQFGARLGYRVLERKRVWLDLAAGSILQVVSGSETLALDPDVAVPPRKLGFGAAPYAQMELRVFVLSRLSIDMIPRLTVPATTRYYSARRALPRLAPILELGAGVSAFF